MNQSLEFDHFLALHLGMMVGTIRSMSHSEYTDWYVYFSRKSQREELDRKLEGARRG